MNLFDTHCHLTHHRLRDDLDGVLARARQAGVRGIVCAASDLDEAAASRQLAHAHADLYFLAGIHPHEARNAPADYLQRLEAFSGDARCVGLGEIGLDYHYDFSPRDVQRRVLAEQLALAGRLGRKVVVHTREAFDETLAILRDSPVAPDHVLLHSCTEGVDHVRRALDWGVFISFSGIVTFKNAQDLREAARIVPRERMLVETDGPFLSPEPVRAMRNNEPANVAHVVARLAGTIGLDAEALAQQTTDNARRFFGIGPAE